MNQSLLNNFSVAFLAPTRVTDVVGHYVRKTAETQHHIETSANGLCKGHLPLAYGSSHEVATVLLPGFAPNG